MALGTWFGQGGIIRVAVGATAHESTIIGVREVQSRTGGAEFTTADGVVHKSPEVVTTTGLEVKMVQDLTAANLWRYLRETASASATVTISGTTSTTESASNPEWVYVCSGWTSPPLEFSQSGTTDTPVALFAVTSVTVDVT
jgi:hypothetical protein